MGQSLVRSRIGTLCVIAALWSASCGPRKYVLVSRADAMEESDVTDSFVVTDVTDVTDVMDAVVATDVRLEAATEAAVCTTGQTLCGPTCVNLLTNSEHCGGCGQTCDLAHAATQRCSASTCAVISCDPGWNNCDAMNSNGCELADSALQSNAMHCGRCGNACAAGQVCETGVCVEPQRSCRPTATSGCGLVTVPGGTFTMGETYAPEAINSLPVQPGQTVSPFLIDRYEVTVARFRRFWNAGHSAVPGGVVAYPGNPAFPSSGAVDEPDIVTGTECNWSTVARGRENHPVTCLTWATAQAFCVWDGGRLPTEAEWEFAARGTDGRTFPWGISESLPVCANAFGLRESSCAVDDPAFLTGASPWGALQMAGNAGEFCADLYAEYVSSCWRGMSANNPICGNGSDGFDGHHAVRGGSWFFFESRYWRSASRSASDGGASGLNAYVGFRCARSR
jgi:formylglycine-generating enzyme